MHSILAIKPGRAIIRHTHDDHEAQLAMAELLRAGFAVRKVKSKHNIIAFRKQRDQQETYNGRR